MRVWLSHAWDREYDALSFGLKTENVSDAGLADGTVPALVPVRSVEDLRQVPDHASVLIPPGFGGHIPLLEEAVAAGREVYLTVNGLGTKALNAARNILNGEGCVLCYDDIASDDFAFFRQLCWLGSHGGRAAVACAAPARALAVAAMGFDSLICMAGTVDFVRLNQVVQTRREDAVRPVYADEVEALSGMEVSLGVTRPLVAGDVIREEDIAVVSASVRGVSPFLASAVTGKILAYGIAPGEALTFGHLRGEG